MGLALVASAKLTHSAADEAFNERMNSRSLQEHTISASRNDSQSLEKKTQNNVHLHKLEGYKGVCRCSVSPIL